MIVKVSNFFKLLTFLILIMNGLSSHSNNDFKVISGNVTGVYYPTAGAFCRIINKFSSGKYCAVEMSEGSFSSIDTLKDTPLNFALIQSDIAYQQYKSDFAELRKVFVTAKELFTVIVPANSNIDSFKDLKNKVISFGLRGNGTFSLFNEISTIYKLNLKDFKITDIPLSNISDSLCTGKIDAAILTVSQPNGLVQEIIKNCPTKFVSFSDQVINSLTHQYPFFIKAEIEGNLYKTKNKVKTIAVESALYTTKQNSNENVYSFTKTILSNLDQLHSLHPVFKHYTLKNVTPKHSLVPLHPGAAQYFSKSN